MGGKRRLLKDAERGGGGTSSFLQKASLRKNPREKLRVDEEKKRLEGVSCREGGSFQNQKGGIA